MSMVFGERARDRLLAVGTAVFAASYIGAARGIEDSLLSDAVGAGGVPQGVGIAMAIAAVALFCKTFIGAPPATGGDGPADMSAGLVLLRTTGLVLILVGYGLLLPRLGYPLTISLLVLASGWLAGAALRGPLLLCGVAAGPLLWLMFDRALQVRMPVGSLWG
jgi:putative tricarboxylic transport membrane protein